MRTNEHGYILVELLTALFVLGVVTYTLVPMVKELSDKGKQREIELEVLNLMQRIVEKQKTNHIPCTGSHKESSFIHKVQYEVHWKCEMVQPQLVEWSLEVQWINNIDKIEKRVIKIRRFVPQH